MTKIIQTKNQLFSDDYLAMPKRFNTSKYLFPSVQQRAAGAKGKSHQDFTQTLKF